MNIDFIPSQQALHNLGYREEKIKNIHHWKKSIAKNSYPRFHIIIDGDDCSIHIDKRKEHGAFMKWIGLVRNKNIVNSSTEIDIEVKFLKAETIYLKLIKIQEDINDKINEFNKLRTVWRKK